ncbi:MAG: hypothetical protein D8M57_12055 [Candidatus Scalindua sp. AMX11]|nr:MAG: hypothetical protein DWQ00_01965 [Candidatus Scalindua sp.]NOG85457.1 hypothetical protein [Planctomycetota bacterium]RZV90291.1 MAG: hypothetical protein EX341_06570 [Candidatus Scalindua sp. SCAELEC01]TDE64702.1 MAG: hypothetical protein D8M57_12055 [Candidatus Scalindua sp. AMX11]GJQ60810.1 MAG: hypothetical protein SCALA701_36110 [Candidatus Scalindua sp.]
MRTRSPLIEELQRKIEKTYALNTGITNIEKFVIGDYGYKEFYLEERIQSVVENDSSGSRVFIRDGGDTLKMSIYYPDKLIKVLEENDPRLGLHDDNIDECASFVEELDHFLFIVQNFRQNRPFSLLELELQANVTKYLVLKYFISLQNRAMRLREFDKEYIKYHLFYKRKYDIEGTIEKKRYEDAKKFGMIYTRYIDYLSHEERLRDLRLFSRLTCPSKIQHVLSRKKSFH